jgi:ASC-1-like (ASCH) protein
MDYSWHIQLNNPWFDHVLNGEKIYEGRCFWKQVLNYKIGDILKISHYTDHNRVPYYAKIVEIIKFETFEAALKNVQLDLVLPNVKSIQEGIEIYKKYYKLMTQIENGVCLLKLDIIKKN